MPNPIPPLPPTVQKKAEEFQKVSADIFDGYVHAIEVDMNRHAVKHGQMPRERAHFDITQMLARDVDLGSMAGLLAEAILRTVERKRKGKG